MDNLGNNQKPKGIDEVDLSKTDKRFGKHDFEAVIFVTGFALLITYLLFFGTVNETIGKYFERTLCSLKPYSVAQFQKTTRTNNEVICTISGDSSYVDNTYFAYEKDKIHIYDSLQMTKRINSITVPGKIISVHCYYNDYFGFEEYMKKDSEIKKTISGMFVYCEYTLGKSTRLMCMNIGRNNYDRYADLKYYRDRYGPDEENIKKHYFSCPDISGVYISDETKKSILDNHKDIYNNWVHPAKTIRKLFDVDIGNARFLSFSFWEKATSTIIVSKQNGVVTLLDDEGKPISKLTFSKIIWCHAIPGEPAYCLLFDGSRLTDFNVNNNVLKIDKSCQVKLNAGAENYKLFINDEPANEIPTSGYILHNGGDLEGVDLQDLGNTKLGIKVEPVSFGSIYYTDNQGETVFFSLVDDAKVSTRFKILDCEGSVFSNKQMDAYRYCFQRTYMVLTSDQQNNNSIVIIFTPHLFALSTSGIDEPVDEAHVTYEDGRLTVYFMNKNSIYRWQNSQVGIDNLKLRKLDIKPEPIKATEK